MSRTHRLNFAARGLCDDELQEAEVALSCVPEDCEGYDEVDFSENLITALGLARLQASYTHFHSLRILKLYKNSLGDAAAGYLTSICKACPMLIELHLSHNNLTGSGVKEIISECASNERVEGTHRSRSPLWLRLEMNIVRKPGQLLEAFALRRLKVCNMTRRCTHSCCVLGMRVHLPYFLNQRNSTRMLKVHENHVQAAFTDAPYAQPRARELSTRSAPRSIAKLGRESASLPEEMVRSIVLGETGENLKYLRDAHPGVTVKFKFNVDSEGPALVLRACASARSPKDALAAAIAASKEAEEDVRDLVRTVRANLKLAAKDGRPQQKGESDVLASQMSKLEEGLHCPEKRPRHPLKENSAFALDQIDTDLKMRILEIAKSYELEAVVAGESKGNAGPDMFGVDGRISLTVVLESPTDTQASLDADTSCTLAPKTLVDTPTSVAADGNEDYVADHVDDSSEGDAASETSIPANWEDLAEGDAEENFEKRLAWLRMDPELRHSVVALVREPGEFNEEDEDDTEQTTNCPPLESFQVPLDEMTRTAIDSCPSLQEPIEHIASASEAGVACEGTPLRSTKDIIAPQTSVPVSWEELAEDSNEALQQQEHNEVQSAKADQNIKSDQPKSSKTLMTRKSITKIDVFLANACDVQTGMVTGEPRVVHRGEGFLVLFKPPYCLCNAEVVSKGVARYICDYGIEDVDKALCHRLDYATSGLLLVGTTARVASDLVRQRNARAWTKNYVCLIHGWLPAKQVEGRLNFKLTTTRRGNGFKTLVDEKNGTWAETLYTVLGLYRCRATHRPFTLLGCSIVTGRTHQIRVHVRELSVSCGLQWCGIVGDAKYLPSVGLAFDLALFQRASIAAQVKIEPRLCLHACELGFVSPRTGRRTLIKCGIPNDIMALLQHAMESVPDVTPALCQLSSDLQWVLKDSKASDQDESHQVVVDHAKLERVDGAVRSDTSSTSLKETLSFRSSSSTSKCIKNRLCEYISKAFGAWVNFANKRHAATSSLCVSHQAYLHAAFEWWYGLVFVASALLNDHIAAKRKLKCGRGFPLSTENRRAQYSMVEVLDKTSGAIADSRKLPPDWKAQWDPESNDCYYWNTKTRQVTWDLPASHDKKRLPAEESAKTAIVKQHIPNSRLSSLPFVIQYLVIQSWEPSEIDEKDRSCIRVTHGERAVLEIETLDGWVSGSIIPEAGESSRSGWFRRNVLGVNPAPPPTIWAKGAHVKVVAEFIAPAHGYLSVSVGDVLQVQYQIEPFIWVWASSTEDSRRKGWLPEALLASTSDS